MKYSTKLSDTVHVMVLIAINQEKSLSSASIAESVHTNPGFVRQLMVTCSHHLISDFEVGASCSMALLSQVSTSYPRVPRDFY